MRPGLLRVLWERGKINGGVQALEDAATGCISDLVMSKTFEELTTMKLAHELSKDVRGFCETVGACT